MGLYPLLEKEGHSVETVADGKETLAVLPNGQFELILMDVQMPGLDGIELTQMVREQETNGGPHIPMVARTAYPTEKERQQCLKAGMDGSVAKPYRCEGLAAGCGAGELEARRMYP